HRYRGMGGKVVAVLTVQLRLVKGISRAVLLEDLGPRIGRYLRSIRLIIPLRDYGPRAAHHHRERQCENKLENISFQHGHTPACAAGESRTLEARSQAKPGRRGGGIRIAFLCYPQVSGGLFIGTGNLVTWYLLPVIR